MSSPPPVDPVTEAARAHFGIPYLFPYQRLVISNVLEAMDAHRDREPEETEDLHDRQIVILPTGAGKSLCFQIPARIRPGLTLVLFPLLSLMADQERRMREAGFQPAILSGAVDADGKQKLWQRLAREPSTMLLTNPESTVSPGVRRRLRSLGVSHLVIDEAHCVTEWGESFRPAYRSLASLIEETEPEVVTAFTATASPRIIDDLRELLFPGGAHLIRADPDRPNITYALLPTLSRHRSLRLLYGPRPEGVQPPVGAAPPGHPAAAPSGHPAAVSQPASPGGGNPEPGSSANLPALGAQGPAPRPSILFCRSRGEAERAAAYLRRFLPAERCYFYHAGLSREEKRRVEEWFFASGEGVLVATCAYGMGVDKKDIKSVVHLRPASSVESYLQESGRAGRDGSPAQAALLLSPSDLEKVSPEGREAAYLTRLLSRGCRREALLSALGSENESCSGCDHCNRSAATLNVPTSAFRRRRLWPLLEGSLFTSTISGALTPSVRESRSFLSPYWESCGDWGEEELKEALEEWSALSKRLQRGEEVGEEVFPTEQLRLKRGRGLSRGGPPRRRGSLFPGRGTR